MKRAVVQMQPIAVPAPTAAAALGMGETKFKELVKAGRLPPPVAIDGLRLWRLAALEEAFVALGETDGGSWTGDFS